MHQLIPYQENCKLQNFMLDQSQLHIVRFFTLISRGPLGITIQIQKLFSNLDCQIGHSYISRHYQPNPKIVFEPNLIHKNDNPMKNTWTAGFEPARAEPT